MIESEERTVWFPEPATEDDSFARKRESTFAWVSRATSEKGTACRRFLNSNISKAPCSWRSKLYNDFRTRDWDSVFFELIVGRTMQILGALIEIEVPVKETNRRPDFIARFSDGAVTVEATVPEINESVNRQMSWNEELVEIIEALTPADWSVEVWRLPKLGPNDSKKDFKRTIKKMFEELPSQARVSDDSIRIEMESGFDGELALTLKPGRKGKRAAPVRGMASGADDTEQRIRAAVTRKKKQVKKVNTPVILAVRTDAFGELEDYDRALYGLTYEHVDLNGKTVRTGFDPVGVFGKKRREPPTCAGVLAYTEVGFPRVKDPVVYIHPRYDGALPDSLMSLEVRTLEGTGVRVQPARMKKILAELELVY